MQVSCKGKLTNNENGQKMHCNANKQTLKQHTSFNCIHSSSNSNPGVGRKLKAF